MAHDIDTMFYAGVQPWHGLGVSVEKELTAADAIKKAGLSWKVALSPVFTAGSEGGLAEVPGFKATVRVNEDGTRVALGVVGDRYQPIQNEEAFAFFDDLVGQGAAVYHTAGSLGRGERVWILAKVPGDLWIEKNAIEQFVLLTSSHDGTACLLAQPTPVRVVCRNTLNMALQSEGNRFRCRHTKNFRERAGEAARIIGLVTGYYEKLSGLAMQFAATEFTPPMMQMAAQILVPDPNIEPGQDPSPGQRAAITRAQEKRGELVYLFANGRGNRGRTAWDALNATVEWTDHHRLHSADQERNLKSIWFGSGAAFKQSAMRVISDIADIDLAA